MRYSFFAFLTLVSVGCASHRSQDVDCVTTQMLDPNAVYEAGIYTPLTGPIIGQPAVNLRISNVSACGEQGTNCGVPNIIGEVTVMMTLISTTCDHNYKLPEPGAYNVGSPQECTTSASATYQVVTATDLHPNPVPLTTGQFVIDTIAWNQENEPQITALSGHMDLNLPDGSHLVQRFSNVKICE